MSLLQKVFISSYEEKIYYEVIIYFLSRLFSEIYKFSKLGVFEPVWLNNSFLHWSRSFFLNVRTVVV